MAEYGIENMLDDAIIQALEDLEDLEKGSENYAKAVENVVKLYKLRLEEAKSKHEAEQQLAAAEREAANREREAQLKERQLAEQVKDRYFKLGVDTAGILLPLAFYAVWMRRGFKFEESGTFTSTTFRGLFNRFRPTKN